MKIYDIIEKKRDRHPLSKEEINYFVQEYANGNIPDYQISALLMAIFINKMTDDETFYLTKAIIDSGETVDLSSIKGIKVDKHSTGGVGDSTTLILGPMIAACGVPFAKMSGRGLGHTGGTLDKLESIKGFNVNLSRSEFVDVVNKINISICSQTANITPADKKLYALRDVTATVDNISLISSSIMSKKLAIQSDGIVLDVKVGSGAFMKNIQQAESLAREMVRIGNAYGRNTLAVVTNMDQPLGNAIGNALEVKEAVKTLKGEGPSDLEELCIVLGSKLLVLAKKVCNELEGKEMIKKTIENGSAYRKLLDMVRYHNGDISMIEDTELLPTADYILDVKSTSTGYVKAMNAENIGKCALSLGAGRETLNSKIDMSAGLVLNKKIDDFVEVGDTLAYIHTNDMIKGQEVYERILDIYKIGDKNLKAQKLILEEIKY